MSGARQMLAELDACAAPRPSSWDEAWQYAQSIKDPNDSPALAGTLLTRYRLSVADAIDIAVMWAAGLPSPVPATEVMRDVMIASRRGRWSR